MICIPAENAYVSADSSDCLLLVLLLACCILQNKIELNGTVQYEMKRPKTSDKKIYIECYIWSEIF